MNYRVRDEHQRQILLTDLGSKPLPFSVEVRDGGRTLTQNRALHLWLKWLAEALNAAGCDMRRTLKPEAEIPWTAEAAKEHLWKPIQEAMTGKASTADADRPDYARVQETLARHMASKLGVQAPPWPKKEDVA